MEFGVFYRPGTGAHLLEDLDQACLSGQDGTAVDKP